MELGATPVNTGAAAGRSGGHRGRALCFDGLAAEPALHPISNLSLASQLPRVGQEGVQALRPAFVARVRMAAAHGSRASHASAAAAAADGQAGARDAAGEGELLASPWVRQESEHLQIQPADPQLSVLQC